VNVLHSTQGELCWQFSKTSVDEPFEGVSWTPAPVTASPIIEGAIAWIDCSIYNVVDAGDHHFVMGRIEDMDHHEPHLEPEPLLFYKGKLGGFSQHP
jgi:flavin reductase (DIM6/NTAB) family NADH-FMN oxidoreductase RutF